MRPPLPNETVLEGSWLSSYEGVRGDEVNDRIDLLIRNYFVETKGENTGWIRLFQDPADQRLWQLYYPQSDLHGGGPMRLRVV